LSSKFNKANPQNGVRALTFGVNSNTLERFFTNQEATATYGSSGDSFDASTYSLCMQFPLRSNISRVEVDVSNVASQCSTTVPVPFYLNVGVLSKLNIEYLRDVGYRLTSKLEAKTSSASTSASHPDWTTVSVNLTPSMTTDILCFAVHTKGFSFSGRGFDQSCKFKLHGVRVF